MSCNSRRPASGVAWASYFYFYEGIKTMYSEGGMKGKGDDRLSAVWHTLSAAQAGAMVGVDVGVGLLQ